MDIYKESILEEFREYSHIQYNALKTARIEYPADNEMLITMEDTVLNRSMEGEILQILEKILVERCGFSVKLHAAYVEKEAGRFKEEEEAKIRMKVDAIYSRTRGRKEEAVDSTAPAQNTEQENTQSPEAKKTDNSGKAKSEPAGGVTKSFQSGGRGEFKRGEFKKGEFRKGGSFEKGALKRSDNPDVIYGRDFEEEAMKIEELIGDMGEVTIRGKVLSVDTRDIKNEKTIIIFNMSDFTDTMTIKIFVRTEQVKEVTGDIKPGAFLKVKGICMMDKFDHELAIGSIAGIKKIPDFTNTRMDTSARKRVELHCHTKMSDMDGVSEAKDIVKRAYKWGHRAIAITDHGVVQSFTDANHVWDDLWKAEKGKRKEAGDENPDKQDFFKIIYGVEAYLVDDLKEIVTNDKGQGLHEDYVVFDIETTGFSPVNNRIIEIGAVKLDENFRTVSEFHRLIRPRVYRQMHFKISEVTHMSMEELEHEGLKFEDVVEEFIGWCGDDYVLCTWGNMDLTELQRNMVYHGLEIPFPFPLFYYDVQKIYSLLHSDGKQKDSLDRVVEELGLLEGRPFHRALDDAYYTGRVMASVDFGRMKDYISVDYYRLPEYPDEEIYLKFPSYSKFVSCTFETKEEAVSEKYITDVVCYKCGRTLRKKIRWFLATRRYICAWPSARSTAP